MTVYDIIIQYLTVFDIIWHYFPPIFPILLSVRMHIVCNNKQILEAYSEIQNFFCSESDLLEF